MSPEPVTEIAAHIQERIMTATDEKPAYVIMGATGGIGSALSRILAAKGARLLLTGRQKERVEALASGLAWLLDPAQNWVTGQVLGIDGGLSSVMPRIRV